MYILIISCLPIFCGRFNVWNKWMFPKIGVVNPQNGWCFIKIRKTLLKTNGWFGGAKPITVTVVVFRWSGATGSSNSECPGGVGLFQRRAWSVEPKIGVENTPPNHPFVLIGFSMVFHFYKTPSILGVYHPYFWKHPVGVLRLLGFFMWILSAEMAFNCLRNHEIN